MSLFTPLVTKEPSSRASLCATPEIALRSPHLMGRVRSFGSVYAFGVILLSFYYPFLGRLTIATGLSGLLSLIGYLNRGE